MTLRERDAIEAVIPREPTDEELAILSGFNELYNLVQTHGVEKVEKWLKTAAAILAQEA